MFDSLFNLISKPDKKLQDVFIGSGSYSIKVSKQLLTERDDKDGTVLIYPKGSECITLRIDVLSFHPKDESIEPTSGYDYVLRDSQDKNQELIFGNDKVVAFSEKKSVENGTNLIMKFWEIGFKDNRFIIMSGTVLESKQNDKRVLKVLTSIPDMIRSIEPAQVHNIIKTPDGEVNYTTSSQEHIEQKIIKLNSEDHKFIKTWNKNGRNIVLYYKPEIKSAPFTIEILDSVFSDWLNDSSEAKFSSDSIAKGLGVLFGDLLSNELKMKWVKVIDDYGEDYGVRSRDNLTAFPIASIYKRIESGVSGFFSDIFVMLKHSVGNSKVNI